MRRGGVLLLIGLTCTGGCKHENLAATVPVVEEFTVPPDDPRYNQPPMAEYKKPQPKKEWGARPGQMGGGGMGMGGGPGMGGQ